MPFHLLPAGIAGGDFDGDKRNAICWQPLVKLVSDNHPPYDAAQASVTYAQRFRPSSVAGAPTAALPTPPVDATKLEERLVANYLMARFNSSALVCRCGIAWQLLAEKRGADHPFCLMADHLYRVGLDAMPPDTAGIHTKYLPQLPAELRGTPYPQYVVAKMQSKPSRRTGTAAGSSSASTPKGVPYYSPLPRYYLPLTTCHLLLTTYCLPLTAYHFYLLLPKVCAPQRRSRASCTTHPSPHPSSPAGRTSSSVIRTSPGVTRRRCPPPLPARRTATAELRRGVFDPSC